jgi:hypothetical protein
MVFGLFSCTTSTEKAKNDLQNKNLRGTVKSITEKTFLERNTQSKKSETQKLLTTTISSFDRDGNVTEEKYCEPQNTLVEKVVFRHNNQNHIIDESHYNSNGTCKNRFTYRYNKQGNPIEKDCVYPANCKNTPKFIFRYDHKGYLVEDGFYPRDSQYGIKSVYLHDATGFLTERDIYDQTNHLWGKYIYQYDSKGNMSKAFNYKGNKILNEKFTYGYLYDPKGNWTNQVLSINGTKESTTNRTIEYY